MRECVWKIKDGLFLGSWESTSDYDLIDDHKVTRIVNCDGVSIPNSCEEAGVKYLTFNFADNSRQIILEPDDAIADQIFTFMDEAIEEGESALVQSSNGQSRSCCIILAYMMKKFRWKFEKALEYLSSRQPDHKLQARLMQQLQDFEERLKNQPGVQLSLDWVDTNYFNPEEALLRNTTLNAQPGPWSEQPPEADAALWNPRKLVWLDDVAGDIEKPHGADKHNINADQDKAGNLLPRGVIKTSQKLRTNLDMSRMDMSTTAGSDRTTSVSTPASVPPLTPLVSADSDADRSMETLGRQESSADLRVYRFFLSFSPPALAIEWGREAKCASAGSKKTCTRIEFTLDELIDVHSLASRLIAEQPYLRTRHQLRILALLKQLSSRSWPTYRVIQEKGVSLHNDPGGKACREQGCSVYVPHRGIVLVRESISRADGWWVRIWSGEWLHAVSKYKGTEEIAAIRCDPSPQDVSHWLQDATFSRDNMLIKNARMVAKQLQVDVS